MSSSERRAGTVCESTPAAARISCASRGFSTASCIPPLRAISATDPTATSLPLCITTTWLQVCSTSASRWLEITTVRPVAAYRRSTSRISAICSGSRPLVGSSRTSSSGSPSIDWAIARRCLIPWLKVLTRRSTEVPRPAISRAVSNSASSGGRPVVAQKSLRLSRPDRCGSSPGPSMNDPIRDSTGAPASTSSPNTCTVPAVGRIRPIRTRRTVVLPAPLGPSSPTTCPRSTRKLTPSTARYPSP
jgi:hypothetical protein